VPGDCAIHRKTGSNPDCGNFTWNQGRERYGNDHLVQVVVKPGKHPQNGKWNCSRRIFPKNRRSAELQILFRPKTSDPLPWLHLHETIP